jgi:hypothetical protein
MTLRAAIPLIVAHIRFAFPQNSIADLRWIQSQLNRHYGNIIHWRDHISDATYIHPLGRSLAVFQVPVQPGDTEQVQRRKIQSLQEELQRIVGILKPRDYKRVQAGEWEVPIDKNITILEHDRMGNPLTEEVEVDLPDGLNPFYKTSQSGFQSSVRVSTRISIPMLISTSDFIDGRAK